MRFHNTFNFPLPCSYRRIAIALILQLMCLGVFAKSATAPQARLQHMHQLDLIEEHHKLRLAQWSKFEQLSVHKAKELLLLDPSTDLFVKAALNAKTEGDLSIHKVAILEHITEKLRGSSPPSPNSIHPLEELPPNRLNIAQKNFWSQHNLMPAEELAIKLADSNLKRAFEFARAVAGPNHEEPPHEKIRMWTKKGCIYCDKTVELLASIGIKESNIEKVHIYSDKDWETLHHETGAQSVPQIYIGKHFVGGYDKLLDLHENKQLPLLLRKKEESIETGTSSLVNQHLMLESQEGCTGGQCVINQHTTSKQSKVSPISMGETSS